MKIRRRWMLSCSALDAMDQAQRPVPVTYPGEGISLAPGIKDDESYGHFVEIQLVDQAVAWLACQIP